MALLVSMRTSIGIIIAVAALTGLWFLFSYQSIAEPSPQPTTAATSTITTVAVDKENLVAEGKSLSRVEFWAIPTGTGITADAYQKLGEARLVSREGTLQRWELPIPDAPMLVTEIFARGFNAANEVVASSSLPLQGASPIYDALWATTP